MYAQIAINIEAALKGSFHYYIPSDLQDVLALGHLVEVEFGRRLAQGIVLKLDSASPVEETKPVISLIDPLPVLRPWQLQLAQWLSQHYLAPLNSCLRLMLPPGLTRWSDSIYDINPYWEGDGRLTEKQQALLEILQDKALRSRQISRNLGKKSEWQPAAEQLVRRNIVRKASILDPPRIRPKMIKTTVINAGPEWKLISAANLGRKNLQAEILLYLLQSDDPVPSEEDVLQQTGASAIHLDKLIKKGLVRRTQSETLVLNSVHRSEFPDQYASILTQLPRPKKHFPQTAEALESQGLVEFIEQPATISLAQSEKETFPQIMRLKRAEKYYQIMEILSSEMQSIPVSKIFEQTGANLNHLRRLQKLDLIQFGSQEIWRDSMLDRDYVSSTAPQLTADQQKVWDEILQLWDEMDFSEREERQPAVNTPHLPLLLHGVTGSGKTEIYMKAIDLCIKQGRQAVVLVPEIALTPQTVRRFASRFPGKVAVLHSRLSDGERYDTWRRARQGLIDIVVGPRSALFTPLENIGVIVVDEEHDASYRQTPPVPPPYYHARDTAVATGRYTGANVILGSATPDVVSYHRAQAGQYYLAELPKRIMGHRLRVEGQAQRLNIGSKYSPAGEAESDAYEIEMPPVQIIDLRQELRAGNRSIFSRELATALDETLDRGEQAILFLNRRGTATFVICRDCGHVLHCPRCDMPLTYHRPRMMLSCHHCGRQEPPHSHCPKCSSKRIKYFGLGTEEVETRVKSRWPNARITRWDRDTTAGKDTHEKLLSRFIERKSDVLVGTQMIAKGLDLPFVTLVGVISADVGLGLPDYRTGERTFQLLAQVAGRAGRGLLGGRVIIQTYQPDHYAIQAASEHDFASFYLEEIRFRTQHLLPPFRRLAKLVLTDPIADRARRHAENLARDLKVHLRKKVAGATEVIGPVPPFFSRVDGRYRWQIILRSPSPTSLLADFQIPRNWTLEIDPVSTL